MSNKNVLAQEHDIALSKLYFIKNVKPHDNFQVFNTSGQTALSRFEQYKNVERKLINKNWTQNYVLSVRKMHKRVREKNVKKRKLAENFSRRKSRNIVKMWRREIQ